jgi:hydroxyethylthiazole kinase-like uncharacterized protein yjeF
MTPETILQHQVAKLLPMRPKDSHKGMYGKVAVIGGAKGMTGAALLAARAALKMGSGAVHALMLSDIAVDFAQPELMLHDAHQSESIVKDSDVLVAGCGMGVERAAQNLLAKALHHKAPLVLDADALNAIAMHSELQSLLSARKHPTILTPHPGEAARLLRCSASEIQSDRISAVQDLARKYRCSVALKGADTLCATGDGKIHLNNTGNPGMSAPGMGDVLSGMIASFIGQHLDIDDALLLAVHLHGAAGDELAKQHAVGMTATELIDQARMLLNRWAA